MVVFDEMKSNVQGETFPQIASNSVKQTPSRSMWNIPVQVYDLDRLQSDNNDGSQQKTGEELLALYG